MDFDPRSNRIAVARLADQPQGDIPMLVPFAAVDAILRLRPDVVVLDISMPGGGGFFVLERIRQQRPAPLVIMLTNFSQDAYRQKCLQLGAWHFFDKSTEFEKVLEVLRGLLPPPRPNRRATSDLRLW